LTGFVKGYREIIWRFSHIHSGLFYYFQNMTPFSGLDLEIVFPQDRILCRFSTK